MVRGLADKMMSVIDRNDPRLLLYPAIEEVEERMQIVRSDILPSVAKDVIYFPLDFRLRSIVLESIARKYTENYEYPSPEEDVPRYFVGTRVFSRMEKISCPYMKKALAALRSDEEFCPKEAILVYLLNMDDGEENHQDFLILTLRDVLLRFGSAQIRRFSYEDLCWSPDGIEAGSYKERVLDEELPTAVFSFIKEFLLLRQVKLGTLSEKHPFSVYPPEVRNAYLRLLTDAAAAEGQLTAEKLLWLEQLARTLRISADDLGVMLEESLRGGTPVAKLQKTLRELIERSADHCYVLYEDIITAAMNPDGSCNREKLIAIIGKKQFAGEDYVRHCRRSVILQQQADDALKQALEHLDFLKVHQTSIQERHIYQNALRLHLLDIGVRS